jgi:hypothetical protein
MRVEFMRAERTDTRVAGLVLSRRNLLALLAKLDGAPDGSACTIMAPIQYGHFFVRAEEDDEHYVHPEREAQADPGPMHPDTEARMRAVSTQSS